MVSGPEDMGWLATAQAGRLPLFFRTPSGTQCTLSAPVADAIQTSHLLVLHAWSSLRHDLCSEPIHPVVEMSKQLKEHMVWVTKTALKMMRRMIIAAYFAHVFDAMHNQTTHVIT